MVALTWVFTFQCLSLNNNVCKYSPQLWKVICAPTYVPTIRKHQMWPWYKTVVLIKFIWARIKVRWLMPYIMVHPASSKVSHHSTTAGQVYNRRFFAWLQVKFLTWRSTMMLYKAMIRRFSKSNWFVRICDGSPRGSVFTGASFSSRKHPLCAVVIQTANIDFVMCTGNVTLLRWHFSFWTSGAAFSPVNLLGENERQSLLWGKSTAIICWYDIVAELQTSSPTTLSLPMFTIFSLVSCHLTLLRSLQRSSS